MEYGYTGHRPDDFILVDCRLSVDEQKQAAGQTKKLCVQRREDDNLRVLRDAFGRKEVKI